MQIRWTVGSKFDVKPRVVCSNQMSAVVSLIDSGKSRRMYVPVTVTSYVPHETNFLKVKMDESLEKKGKTFHVW
jgi:hypothetical protein